MHPAMLPNLIGPSCNQRRPKCRFDDRQRALPDLLEKRAADVYGLLGPIHSSAVKPPTGGFFFGGAGFNSSMGVI